MKRTARWTAAITLVVCACMVAGCRDSGSAKPASPPVRVVNPRPEADLSTITLSAEAEQRLGIETATLELREVASERQLAGELLAPPGRIVLMTAPITGRVEAAADAPLVSGAQVRSGQILLRLTPLATPPRDLRITYEAEATAARARFDVAQKQRDRAQQLLRDGAGSQRTVEQAEREFTDAKAALDAATERLARLDERPLDGDVSVPVRSPFDGVIRRIEVGPGQIVVGGTALFEVVDLRVLWVRVPVYVGHFAAFAEAREVTIDNLDAGPRAVTRPARRVAGPLTADPQAVSADLFFEFTNVQSAFRPGQRVGVVLPSGSTIRSLAVPASAVVYDYQGGAWVYVNTAAHTYARQRVGVARTAGKEVVLARGPAAGSRIVTIGVAELFGTEFGVGK